MLLYIWLFVSCTASAFELKDLLDELSWNLKLKVWKDMQEIYKQGTMKAPSPEPDRKNRRVGIELFTYRREGEPLPVVHSEDSDMRLKLFRLMYESVRDSDLKVKRAELIREQYNNSTTFEIGYLMGDVTDKFNTMTDISVTLTRFYKEWKPLEHINAYEQIANQAIEINHLIDLIRVVNKRDKRAS